MGDMRDELRGESTKPGLIDELAAVHPRVGVEGVLRRRGTRAWPRRLAARAATEGFRWGPLEQWSQRWWPQGVEVLSEADDGILVVSWFAPRRRGVGHGARLTIVDRRDPRRPRYHHVLLVEPVRDSDGTATMETVEVHAGGLARVGMRLYVAATFGGLRSFELPDILEVRGRPPRAAIPFGYRHVLPQSGHQRFPDSRGEMRGEERMRFSFVSVERGLAQDEHLVVGEFGDHEEGGRLGRIPLAELSTSGGTASVTQVHEPGIPRMQGAAVIHGTWFVSASNGTRAGDLWVGAGASWTRHRGVLPPGPEDLTATPDGTRLWSLCEYPRQRWVYAIDPARWR